MVSTIEEKYTFGSKMALLIIMSNRLVTLFHLSIINRFIYKIILVLLKTFKFTLFCK